jgi:putative ABC transport system permease protein
MLRNYLTVAWRNLVRNRLYTAITVSGLAVGLACAIFIALFVRDELSYDQWLPGTDNLYRLEVTSHAPGHPPKDDATIPFMAAQAMQEEIPGVVAFTRLDPEYMIFNYGAKQFGERFGAVDPNFLAMLKLPMVWGDPATALRQPQSVVLSQTTARKYFGEANPLGKVMTVTRPGCEPDVPNCSNGSIALTVTGVFRDIPNNSQLRAEILLPNISVADTRGRMHRQDWAQPNTYAFVRLAPGADPQAVLARFDPILDREVGPRLPKFGIHMPGHAFYTTHLTPFRRVHLDGARNDNMTSPGSWATVYGVSAIGILIMLMACFNFTNLATAQAMLRAREAAVRKTFGARRSQLVVQFLCEAVLFALMGLILALALVQVLLPRFADFLQTPIKFSYLADWPMLALSLAIAVGAGLLSGAYPALILSGARPAAVLRGANDGGGGSAILRTGVVILQFAVSIALGIGTLVVFSQVDHARRAQLGFRHDNIVNLYIGSTLPVASRESLVQQLAGHPGIEAVAQSDDLPFTQSDPLANARLPGQTSSVIVNEMNIGPGFHALYGIPLLAGRDFMRGRTQDQIDYHQLQFTLDPKVNEGHNVMLNQTAAARFGLTPEQAIGRALMLNNAHVVISGVIADAKFHGAHEAPKPMLFYFDPSQAQIISLRTSPEGLPETLAFIDRSFHAFLPELPVSRGFLEASFQSLYSADVRQGQMFGAFVGLAIFIAAMGLFGVTAFTAGRRTKEIGIRKVFGATTVDVVMLLLRQFSMPVLIANVIAWPIAYFYLDRWLQGFADRITLSPLYFVAVGLGALIIAWATIFVHTLRAARANPIQALRYE